MTEETEHRRQLLDTYRLAGAPLATVLLPARSDVADAVDRFEIRIKNCLATLADLGATDAMVATVQRELSASHHGDGAALALVATEDEVLLSYSMFRPVTELFVSLGSTPALLPLLEATQADVPHIAVLLDRVGADIWYRADLGTAVETVSVAGDEEHVHRSHPGGWSQRRFQQVAENTWEDNAKAVVTAILDEASDAEFIVAGGDVRAVGFFAEHLPERLGELLIVDGSRAADPAAFLDNADVAARSVAAERLVADINQFRDALGEGRAVEGAETLDLLSQGRIEQLFVANDTLGDDRWTHHFDFSIPAAVPDGSGIESPATDGAVALAVATGALVTVVPKATVEHAIVGIARGPITVEPA